MKNKTTPSVSILLLVLCLFTLLLCGKIWLAGYVMLGYLFVIALDWIFNEYL